MSARSAVALFLLLSLTMPVLAQKAAPAAAPAGEGLDPVEVMRQMGADEDELAKFQLLSQVLGPDMSPVLLLMMMQGNGNLDEDILPILLLMKAAGRSGGGPAAVLGPGGEELLVVEDGMVYRINLGTMEVAGSVAYRPARQAAGLPPDLLPVLQQAQAQAQATSCLSNMKQLCLAAMMYAQDWDETLPSEEWPEQLQPHSRNTQIYTCPGAPDRAYGFALNEAVTGARMGDIKRPAEVILFFESALPDDLPFGGPDGLLMEPRHAGAITVGFVDGHAKLMPPEEARKLLEQDPFE